MSFKIKKSGPLYNKLRASKKQIQNYQIDIVYLKKDFDPFSGPLDRIKHEEQIAEIEEKIDAEKKHYDKLIFDHPEYFI